MRNAVTGGAVLFFAALLTSCAGTKPAEAPAPEKAATSAAAPADYAALVAAPDRSPEDRKLDGGRRPAETLAFLGVQPGMRVGELGAGGGYTTELLARAVGPRGAVYAENPKVFLGFVNDVWTRRLAKPEMAAVVRADRELEDPFPPEAKDLDLVVFNAVYHDAVWIGADRAKMNRAVLEALKPGGAFVIIDSSAKPGSGIADVKTLHRIDEQVVRDELKAAGFRLAGEGSFLRNPADTRDWSASPMAAGERRGTSDRFALRFVKP
jgi:predicted methyltransferase